MDLVPSTSPARLRQNPANEAGTRLGVRTLGDVLRGGRRGRQDAQHDQGDHGPDRHRQTLPGRPAAGVPGDGAATAIVAAAMQISGTADRQPLTGRGGPAALPLTRRHRPWPRPRRPPCPPCPPARRAGRPAPPLEVAEAGGQLGQGPLRLVPLRERQRVAGEARLVEQRRQPRRRAAGPGRLPAARASSSSGVSAAALAVPARSRLPSIAT